MNDVIQIAFTAGSRDEADKIARHLVESRLAACVQIIPSITSVYRWQGKIEQGEEVHCTIKTVRSHYESVEAEIRRLHSYDEPEILAVPVVAASQTYVQWLRDEVDVTSS